METHSDTLELSDVERSTSGTMGPRESGPVLVSSYWQWLPPARRGLKPPGNLNILSRSVALLVPHVQTQFLWISIDSDHDPGITLCENVQIEMFYLSQVF